MNKTKTKILKGLFVVGMVLMATMLAACGKVKLNVEGNIKEQMFQKETYLVENVYGKQGTLDFNTSGSNNFISNENYYVKIATEISQEVSQIKLGEVVYSKSDKAETKVSSVNTLSRSAFILEENALFVSNVLMFLNTSNDGVLRISFPKNNFHQIDVKVFEGDENKLELKAVQGTQETLTVIDEMALKYKFKNNNPNGKVFLEMKEDDNAISDTANILLQTVANPNKQNQSMAARFENPTILSNSNKGIEVNPGYNQGNAYTETSPADHTLVYNVYVPGVGAKTVIVEFENTFVA